MGFKHFAVAAVLALLFSAPVRADEARWTHPDGIYSLAPIRADARLLDAFDGEIATFQIGPEAVPVRLCSIDRERRIPGANNVTQPHVNGLFADIMRAQRSTPELTITDQRSFDRNGVTVVATRVVTGAAIYHFWRFALARPSGATYHEISCGGAAPVSATEEAVFAAFLDSLQFSPTGTPQ